MVEVLAFDLVAVDVADEDELTDELVWRVVVAELEVVEEMVADGELEDAVVVLDTEELVDDLVDVVVVDDCKETTTVPVMNGCIVHR